MRRIIKFLGVAIIAVLITVLVMNNNAKADAQGSWVEKPTEVNIGSSKNFKFSFEQNIIGGQIDIEQSGEGSVVITPQAISIASATSYFEFSCKGETAGQVTLSFIIPGDQKLVPETGDHLDYNIGSITFEVKDETEPPEPPTPVEGKTPVLTPSSTVFTVGDVGSIQVANSDEVAVDWSSSNPLVVNFTDYSESKCDLTAVSAGTATITATSKTDSSKKATVDITVNPKHEEIIDEDVPVITPSSNVKISVGSQKTLAADKGVMWQSSDSSIVSIGERSGIIKGVAEGKATITAIALSNNKTASIEVTVEPKSSDQDSGDSDSADPVITPSEEQTIKIGETIKLTADKAVTWSTGNKSIATVDSEGNVKGVGAGSTEISATTNDGRFSTVKVTVNANKSNSNGKTPTNTTGNATTDGGNSSSTVNEEVPKTGEASTTTLIVIGVITLIIATVIFRKKAK